MKTIEDTSVMYEMFVSSWLEHGQIRVIEQSKNTYIIKARRKLTEEEVKGAIVRFHLRERQKKLY